MFCVTKIDIVNALTYTGLIYILMGSQIPPERLITVIIVGFLIYFVFFRSSDVMDSGDIHLTEDELQVKEGFTMN